MGASLVSTKPKVKPFLNPDVYAALNMDAHRKKRLQALIERKFDGNQKAFGEEVGLSKGRVSQLLDPDEPFGERAAKSLVEKLKFPDRWFELEISNVSSAPQSRGRRIPVVAPIVAGNFKEIVDAYATGSGEQDITTDLDVSKYTFALKIEGDSMQPVFQPGDLVVIDPDVQPTSGDFVAARNGEEGATFKKYRARGADPNGREVFELIPLNDKYGSVRSDLEPLQVIGTMVEHRTYRRPK